jgi:hypothetical protein
MSDVQDFDDHFGETLSEVANALQTAGLLASLQRRQAGDLAQNAVNLESALERATHAIRRLQRQVAGATRT